MRPPFSSFRINPHVRRSGEPPPKQQQWWWRRIPKERQRVWGMVLGILTVGTIVKVAYFKFSRKILVRDADRQHEQGRQSLHEAHQFAAWSAQDRRQRLPPLTAEQRKQVQDYLLLLEEHGWHKSFAQEDMTQCADGTKDRRQCPILRNTSSTSRNRSATAAEESSS